MLPDLPPLPTGCWPHAVVTAHQVLNRTYSVGLRLLEHETNDPVRLKVAADFVRDKKGVLAHLTAYVGNDAWTQDLQDMITGLEEQLRKTVQALSGM